MTLLEKIVRDTCCSACDWPACGCTTSAAIVQRTMALVREEQMQFAWEKGDSIKQWWSSQSAQVRADE